MPAGMNRKMWEITTCGREGERWGWWERGWSLGPGAGSVMLATGDVRRRDETEGGMEGGTEGWLRCRGQPTCLLGKVAGTTPGVQESNPPEQT
jgi:hypothetical protein